MSGRYKSTYERGAESMAPVTESEPEGAGVERRGLPGYLIDTYLRVGLLAAAIFAGVALIAELARGDRRDTGFALYPPYQNYPELPVPHPAGLTSQEVERLLAGQDGEYSRVAEFHGYPAPGEVLPLAQELLLSPEQIRQLESILASTEEAARATGSQIVHLEAQLGSSFGDRTVSSTYLHALSQRLGLLYGKLREIHLEGYIAVARILAPDQLERYSEIRSLQEQTTE